MDLKPFFYPYDPRWKIPDVQECLEYWEEYHLPEHIREHSMMVAVVAENICRLAGSNLPVPREAVLASALLHDIGKFYCIEHGGSHNQLGASVVMELTANPAIAQGVMHHVYWPGDLDVQKFFLPLVLIYSDKRVKHNRIVTLKTRFDDLYARYGVDEKMKSMIQKSWDQAVAIETDLNHKYGVNLNAYTFDSRRLV
ncbi:MAG: HDIG domain-containing metalloprotein [Desulfonatronovibrionaceae bacterium]